MKITNTAGNRQFGKMAGIVLNSTAVLRLKFCTKPNICASISATSPSCKPKNEVTDNGQELKGYYQNNQLKKITHSVGLSLWKIIREYFYYKNELIFVLETKFQTNDENGFINNPKLIYKNSYYFNNNKLIKKIVKETSDTIDFVKEANELKKDLKNYK